LIGSGAAWAGPFDVPIGKEAAIALAVGELEWALLDDSRVLVPLEDELGIAPVVGRVGRVVVVELHAEVGEVPAVLLSDAGDELERRQTQLLGLDLDRRAVRVVGADVNDVPSAGPQEPHVDVGLQILDQMAQVNAAIGVRQRARHKDLGHWFLHVARRAARRRQSSSTA
jgi:hypothetical protein